MDITASNKYQLIEILRAIDISVPPRRSERTNDHVERWSIARLLATLAESGDLAYPLRTEKRERPDYFVSQNSKKIGYEITEAINPQYIQAQSLPEAQEEQNIVDAGHFKWGNKHNLDQLRDISSRKHLTAPPWEGNSVEREYAQMVRDIVQKKTEVLNKSGFTKYAENNLIIYVNQILPILVSEEATKLCSEGLLEYWENTSFDNVYAECYSEIHIYNKGGAKVTPLNNLWK
jgi:hypothetical protein